MKKVISLIACLAIVVFAQDEQYQPQIQCQCQCPPQREYQYQYQYQYPPQQEQYQPQQRQIVNMEKRIKIQILIDDGIEKNKKEIMMESVYLSPTDIEILYEKNKKTAMGWALNGLGFGIGSYTQGNIVVGIAQTILDGFGSIFVSKGNIDDVHIGAAAMLTSRILGMTYQFIHQNTYNKILKTVLYHSLSYSIDPLIVPKDGAPAVGLAFNLRY
jgi:hypothetical protein